MGVCKYQDSWRVKYPWAVAVPSDVYKAGCKYCLGKLIDVKCGAQALARHEGSSMHSAGAASVSSQPDIQQSLLPGITQVSYTGNPMSRIPI